MNGWMSTWTCLKKNPNMFLTRIPSKKFEHYKDEYEGWKTCKVIMVSLEAQIDIRGAKALVAWTYSPIHPRAKLW